MSTEGEREKETWRDSLPTDMLFSAVSVLVVAQQSSGISGGTYELSCIYINDQGH